MKLIVLIFMLFACNASYACSCAIPAYPSKKEFIATFNSAEMVFVGIVVSDVDLKKSFSMVDQEVSLNVIENFKGASEKTQKVSIGLCGFEFETGKTYLVYAYKDYYGKLSVSVCSFSKKYAKGSRELKLLRKAAN